MKCVIYSNYAKILLYHNFCIKCTGNFEGMNALIVYKYWFIFQCYSKGKIGSQALAKAHATLTILSSMVNSSLSLCLFSNGIVMTDCRIVNFCQISPITHSTWMR